MVHWGQWHFAASETHPMGGMEFQFTLLMIALYFVIVGNGTPTPTVGEEQTQSSAATAEQLS